MAESYRGLTIRIGGDTTGLQKALKTSTSAIQGADMELRKLGQALKLDPGNVEAFNLQVGYLGDKATSTAMKLYQMQQAAEQIRGKKMEFFNVETGKEELKVIGEIRKETENVHLQAEKATASYNRVRDELHGLYDNLTKYNQQAVDGAIGGQLDNLKEKLENALTLDSKSIAEAVNTTITQIKGKFDSLEGIIVKPESFDAMAERLKKYAETYSSIEDEAEKNTVAEAFKIVAQDITTATAQVINFDSAWTTPEKLKELKKQLSGISGALELDPSKIDAFFDKIFEYKDKYKSAEDTLQIQNEVARLADLEVEIERAKSSVTDLAKALASMDVPSELMRSMNDLTEKADAYKKAVSESMNRANTAAGEYKLNGDDATRNAAMKEYGDAIKNAKSQLETLNEQMNKFNPEEVKRWSGMTETATQQLVKASVAHAQATKDVKTYEGAVEGALEVLTRLENTAGGEIKILDTDEVAEVLNAVNHFRDELLAFDEANEQASESVKEDLVAALEKLKEAAEAAGETDLAEYFANTIKSVDKMKDNFRGLAEAEKILEGTEGQLQEALRRKDWEGRRNEVMAAKKAIDEATVAEQKFAAGDFKMDTKWIEDLKSARSDLESLGSSVAQEFQQATASISALGGVTDTATTKAKALIDAFASDMGNTDALRLGLDSLNEAFVASTAKAEMLRNLIASYTPDRIDEVAISTGKVGENAATAAAEVKAAFKSLDDAKKKLADLEEAYKKALSVKTDESTLEQYRNDIAAAREEVEKWKVASENALKNLDTAKATQEFVNLRQELARTDADVEKLSDDAKAIAESLATGGTESFAKRVFGDMDAALDSAGGALDRAIDRFTNLTGAIQTLQNESEAAAQQQRAMGEVLSAGSAYVQKLSQSYENLSESISPERVVELKKQYGDLGTASEQTSEKVRLLAQQLVAASTAGDAEEVARLTDELIKATEAANEVATALKLEGLGDSMITSVAEVKEKLKEAIGSDISGMFKSMFAELDNSKSVFDAATARLSTLTKATETLKDNSKAAALQHQAMGEAAAAGAAYEKKLADALEMVSKHVSPERVQELKIQYGDLGTAAYETARKAEDLANEILAVAISGDKGNMDALIAQYNELKKAATEAAAALAQQDISDRSMKVMTDQVEAMKSSARDTSDAFMQAVNNIMQHVERFGSKVIESADTIDSAFRDMRKTVDGTESQFESLRESAIRFSQTSFVSADTMLEMEALGGQLGVTVEKLEQFGAVAANLSIATDIGAEDIALQLGQLTNIMSDLSEDTFQNVGDALVRLGNNTATTESKIMGVAERMAAIANVTSMTTPDLLAWSAAIASTGQRSESAATAINNSITGIGQAVAEGGKKLEAFASIAGMTAEEFKTAWQTSSSDALEAFVKGLGTLTDESTDAIAALDSVGISSVRQETALLALSQTIDNLDNSMKLAREGFNGGGDAAREAAQKAEGFSGALQILRNNVSNLAASFGDGLVPFIKLASGALELLNGIIRSLSPVTKTAIVGITGISTALAVATPVLKKFAEGWKELSADMAASGSMFSLGPKVAAAMTALSGVKDALFTVGATMASTVAAGTSGAGMMSAAFAGLGTAIGGAATALGGLILPIAGIAALVAIIDTAVNAYNDWKQEQEEFNSAMRSARGEMDATKASIEEYAASLKSSSETAEQIAESTSNFLQSQSEFIDSVSGSLEKVGKDTALIESYSQTIQELSGHVDGNKAKMKLLTDTVENYNKLAGSSIQVIDDTTGAVSIQADALRTLTEEYKKNAEAAAWADIYQDATTAYVEAQYQRQKAEMDATEAKKQLTEITKDGVAAWTEEGKKYNELRDKLKEYEEQAEKAGEVEKERKRDLDEFKTVMEAATEATSENAATSEDYSSALSMVGESIDDFNDLTDEQKAKVNEVQSAMVKAGDSLTNYGSLNKDQLVEIVNAWDGSVDDIVALLNKLSEAEESAASSTAPSAEALEEFKRKNEAFYTEQKRIRDDYYDKEKRARDLAYDDAKNQLDDAADNFKETLDESYTYEKRIRDDAADERKNQLDDEYEWEKRLRDKVYDDFKDQLDERYEYEKRIRDDAYDERKNQLDDEYEWEKRLRDDAYDDLKDQLDDAYDAAKQKVDDWLDDYKEALEEEVEAFEKATEERIALMEEEYEAKKKLIDDQEAADTSDIDARIKAIEDQTAAEEKAAKMAERQQKIAEATAKRDKYAAGSKEYEKYDLELKNLNTKYANEDEKERRKEYIDGLKEMKAQIKSNADEQRSLLKDSYDKEKEDFKNSRDAQKEELKKQNDEAYEQQKRYADGQLELVKKSNEDRLEVTKRANEDELKEIKRRLDQESEDYKRANEDELAVIKHDNEGRLEDLKLANEDELTEIKRRLDQELEDYKRANEDELTDIKNSQSQQLEEYKRGNSLILEQLKTDHEQQLLELKRHHEDELTEIKNHIDDENEAFKNGGQPAVDALNSLSDAAGTTTTEVTNAITSAATAIDGEFGKLTSESKTKVTSAMDAIKNGLTSKDPEVVAATQKVVAGMSDELYGIVLAAQKNGMDVPIELSKAIVENAGLSKESIGTLVQDTDGAFGKIPESARSNAENAMLALSTTLTSKTPETVAAAKQFVSENATELAQLVVAAQKTGIDVPPALANAIAENSELPKTPAGTMANAVMEGMDFLPESMKTLVKVAAIGMGNEMQNTTDVVQAAQNLAKQLVGPLDHLSPDAVAKAQAMTRSLATELSSEDPNRKKAAENLVKEITDPLGTIVSVAKTTGENVPPELFNAMVKATYDNKEKPKTITDLIKGPFEALSETMGTFGNNAAVGWNNKFVEKINNTVIPNVAAFATKIASTFAGVHEIQSPSKLFGYYADMDAEGYMQHWDKAENDIIAMMSDMATDVAREFSKTDFTDADSSEAMLDNMKMAQDQLIANTKRMMDDMLVTMREREADLRHQAERMAKIVEDGFDPSLSAAYEAIDTIDAGKLRRQQMIAGLGQKQASITNAPVINISIPQVVMHEKADITAFSEQIARRVRRELAASLG